MGGMKRLLLLVLLFAGMATTVTAEPETPEGYITTDLLYDGGFETEGSWNVDSTPGGPGWYPYRMCGEELDPFLGDCQARFIGIGIIIVLWSHDFVIPENADNIEVRMCHRIVTCDFDPAVNITVSLGLEDVDTGDWCTVYVYTEHTPGEEWDCNFWNVEMMGGGVCNMCLDDEGQQRPCTTDDFVGRRLRMKIYKRFDNSQTDTAFMFDHGGVMVRQPETHKVFLPVVIR